MTEKSEISKQIIEFCSIFYKNYIKFIKEEKTKETIFKGYLIKSDLINDFKNNILYDKLKDNIRKDENKYQDLKEIIENNYDNIKIKRDIIQTKFDNADALIKALEKNSFYLINENLWKGICKESAKNENFGIKYQFNKDKIILIFENGQKLYFKLIEDDCIIEKSLLIKKTEQENNKQNQENKKEQELIDEKSINNMSNISEKTNISVEEFKLRFQDEIIILIKLIFFNENFKTNIIKQKNGFNNENKNKNNIYLIDKQWIEQFKSLFIYKEFKEFLKNKNYLNQNNNIINDSQNIDDNLMKEIISNIPENLKLKINNINNINNIDLLKHEYKTNILKVLKTKENPENYVELKYLTNFGIINNELYNLFKSRQYLDKLLIDIKECKYYYINDKNILIKFNSKDGYIDEIGYFNDEVIFIYKYLLVNYKTNVDELNSLILDNCKKILENSQNNDYYDIIKDNNNNIGFLYNIQNGKNTISIENNETQSEKENNKLEKQENEDNKNENDINQNNYISKSHNKNVINKDNNVLNNEISLESSDKSNNNKYIEFLIYYHRHIIFLTKTFIQPINEKLELKKYYLVQKEWIKLFLDFCEYDKFKENPLNTNIDLKESKIDEVIKQLNIQLPKDFSDKINKEKQNDYLKDVKNFECELEKFENKKEIIYYYNNFKIIDESLYNLIKEIFNFDIKDKKGINFIIGDKKIIMDLRLYGDNPQYTLFIYSKDEKNNEINNEILDILINFKEEKYINWYCDIFKKEGLLKSLKKLNFEKENKCEIKDENNNVIIGIAYKPHYFIDKINHNQNEINKNNELINPIIQNSNETNTNNNTNSNIPKTENTLIEQQKENINKNEIKNTEKSNNISENNKNNNKDQNIPGQSNILLDSFKKEILTLIKYHKFQNKLETQLKSSKNENPNIDIYLINEKYINKYKQFYEYIEIIKKIDLNQDISISNIENILKEINLIDKYKEKEKKYEQFLKELNAIDYKVVLDKYFLENEDEDCIYYPNNFIILNEEIYDEITKEDITIRTNVKNVSKANYLINEDKIIIEYYIDINSILLIGNINKESHIFHSELLLNYLNHDIIRIHFDILKNMTLKIFINNFCSEDLKYIYSEYSHKLFENNKIGNIIILDDKYYKTDLNKKNNDLYKTILLLNDSNNKEKNKHIKFLLRLYFHYEKINHKINQYFENDIKAEKYYY